MPTVTLWLLWTWSDFTARAASKSLSRWRSLWVLWKGGHFCGIISTSCLRLTLRCSHYRRHQICQGEIFAIACFACFDVIRFDCGTGGPLSHRANLMVLRLLTYQLVLSTINLCVIELFSGPQLCPQEDSLKISCLPPTGPFVLCRYNFRQSPVIPVRGPSLAFRSWKVLNLEIIRRLLYSRWV